MLNASARLGVFSAVESVRDAGFGFLRGSPGTEGVLAECSAMSQSRGLVMRAAIQNENGDKAGCAASLRQAAALNPEDSFLQRLVRARLRRGASFLRDKRPDEACAEYRGLLDLVPSDARALHGLGCSLEARGLGEEAWRSFAAAVEAAPSNASFRATLADSSYRLRKIPEALAGYRVALALEPDSPAVLNNCAWLLASAADPSLRDVGEAAGMAERACELTGWRDEHVVETLARIYLIAARYDDAVQAWDTAAAAAGAEEKSRLAGRQGAYVEAIRRIRAEKPR
jgi:Flp pilus assembly protein TadD